MSRSQNLEQSEVLRPEILGRSPVTDRYAEICAELAETLHGAFLSVHDDLTPTQLLELDKEVCGTWDRSWQAIPLPPIETVVIEQISSSAAA